MTYFKFIDTCTKKVILKDEKKFLKLNIQQTKNQTQASLLIQFVGCKKKWQENMQTLRTAID